MTVFQRGSGVDVNEKRRFEIIYLFEKGYVLIGLKTCTKSM